LENHAKPRLGGIRLRDLDRVAVREWRAWLLTNGRSPATVNSVTRVLSAALGAAVEDGLRETNPCRGLKPVPQPPVDRQAIPVRDVELIRQEVGEVNDRLVVSLLAYAGLRPGELVGLTWGNVRDRTILVDRAVSGRGGVVQRTKTGSVRAVPISAAVREDLSAVRARNESDADNPSRPVATGPSGGRLNFHNWSARVWRPAVARLGLSWVPYELRHTFVSLLIGAGHDVVQVAAWAGHSPNVCLARYAHLFAERQGRPGQDVDSIVMGLRGDVANQPSPES
jgi:integrase